MAQTSDFIATLHLIASGDGPNERLKDVVREVLARFIEEVPGNQTAVQVWVVRLQDELTAAMVQHQSARFKIVRDWAHEFAIEWLRDN